MGLAMPDPARWGILDDLFILRMEGNDEIFHRVMSDRQFRSAAQEHLAQEVFQRIHQSASTGVTDFKV
jgi:type I restriction enzyme R subunit